MSIENQWAGPKFHGAVKRLGGEGFSSPNVNVYLHFHRLYDVEGNEEIDVDDMVKVVVKLCQYSKRQKKLQKKKSHSVSGSSASKNSQNQRARTVSVPEAPAASLTPLQLLHQQQAKAKEEAAAAAAAKKAQIKVNEDLERVNLMSNRLGQRVETYRQRQRHIDEMT